MSRITVLYRHHGIGLLHTLYPILRSRHRAAFSLTVDYDEALRRADRNASLLVLDYFGRRGGTVEGDLAQAARLRERYRRVAYLEANDGAECLRKYLIGAFDVYFKKQIFSDPTDNLKDFYRGRKHAHFYHERFGLEDPDEKPRPPLSDPALLSRMEVAWNLCIGCYPVTNLRGKAAVALSMMGLPELTRFLGTTRFPADLPRPNTPLCHARFSASSYSPTVGRQRRLFLELIAAEQGPAGARFVTGRIPPRRYRRELRNIMAVLSPFGWGEVCFRDCEAVMAGAVLVKPDMSHVRTWPDIYLPGETYLPVAWDGVDLFEKAEQALAAGSRRLAENAFEILKAAYAGLDERVAWFISRIEGP